MQEFARVCEQAARAGGDVLRRMQGTTTAREKAPADLVTEADLASQETVRAMLLDAFPEHGFLGEETLAEERTGGGGEHEFTWIVDPLDGTTNYVHGLDNFCVSVALRRLDEIVVGVVYDPIRDECFTATAGHGAFCNGHPLRTSSVESLPEALIAASFPARVMPGAPEIARFLDVLYVSQAVRRLGSAALNLGYVAAGRLDGYWATSVKLWDVAAGLLLVREAGGVVTGIAGERLEVNNPQFVATSNAKLHAELVSVLSKSVQQDSPS